MSMCARVIEDYTIAYPNPIKLKAGESVTIEKWEDKNSEWAGWAFCVDQRGIKGWVSEKYLSVSGDTASVISDYDATELAVEKSEKVQVLHQEFGWAWVKNSQGAEGWIPLKCIAVAPDIELREGYDSHWLKDLMDLHNKTEMKRTDSEQVNAGFQSSFAVVTAWKKDRLVGCGRMISDGCMYSGIFDVVVDPDLQMLGVGRSIIKHLISKAPTTCIHLTSTFGNETFYAKLGFKKHKTAMALYPGKMAASPYLESNWTQVSSSFLESNLDGKIESVEIFAQLVLKAISADDLVVQFSPGNDPRYIPPKQSDRRDKKAIIKMPGEEHRTIMHGDSGPEVEAAIKKVNLENALFLFAHELGHHGTNNPGYDEALGRCLAFPAKGRDFGDMLLVIKEETEAWEKGFDAIRSLGMEIPERANKLARESILGYCTGALTTEPINAANENKLVV